MILMFLAALVVILSVIVVVSYKRKMNLMEQHLSWSYDQHNISLRSIQNLVLNARNDKSITLDKLAFGIEELTCARQDWIKIQWRP